MKSNFTNNLISLVSFLLVLIGFKLASVGSGPSNVQNDGNTMVGGFLILVGGVIFGWWLSESRRRK